MAPAIARLVINEVDAPNVIWIPRPQADDRAVFVVETFVPFVAIRQLKIFFPPQALDLLVFDHPAFDAKELSNLTIAIAIILLGQPNEGQAQFVIVL